MNNIVIALATVIVYSAYRFGRFSARMDQRKKYRGQIESAAWHSFLGHYFYQKRVGDALRDGLVDGISQAIEEERHIHG